MLRRISEGCGLGEIGENASSILKGAVALDHQKHCLFIGAIIYVLNKSCEITARQ